MSCRAASTVTFLKVSKTIVAAITTLKSLRTARRYHFSHPQTHDKRELMFTFCEWFRRRPACHYPTSSSLSWCAWSVCPIDNRVLLDSVRPSKLLRHGVFVATSCLCFGTGKGFASFYSPADVLLIIVLLEEYYSIPLALAVSPFRGRFQIPMSMGQTSFVDVLLCPDVQESEMDADEQEGGLLMEHDDGGVDHSR